MLEWLSSHWGGFWRSAPENVYSFIWWSILTAIAAAIVYAASLIISYFSPSAVSGKWRERLLVAAIALAIPLIATLAARTTRRISVSIRTWRQTRAAQIELREVRGYLTSTNDPNQRRLYAQLLPRAEAGIEACQGHLLCVWKWHSLNRCWFPTELNQPLDLIWSYHDSAPRNLLPGIYQWLNIFWISNLNQQVTLETNPIPVDSLSILNFTDTFRFDIRVTARNCEPVDISLRVRIGERWDIPEVLEKL